MLAACVSICILRTFCCINAYACMHDARASPTGLACRSRSYSGPWVDGSWSLEHVLHVLAWWLLESCQVYSEFILYIGYILRAHSGISERAALVHARACELIICIILQRTYNYMYVCNILMGAVACNVCTRGMLNYNGELPSQLAKGGSAPGL